MKPLRVLKYVGFGILGIAFVILVIFGVQALWNWLIPDLFNGPVLNYWQTAGLFLLSKILLTGVAPGGDQHSRKKNCSKKEWDKNDWRRKFQDKFKQVPEDEQNTATAEQV
jgi:hypothetical protein